MPSMRVRVLRSMRSEVSHIEIYPSAMYELWQGMDFGAGGHSPHEKKPHYRRVQLSQRASVSRSAEIASGGSTLSASDFQLRGVFETGEFEAHRSSKGAEGPHRDENP